MPTPLNKPSPRAPTMSKPKTKIYEVLVTKGARCLVEAVDEEAALDIADRHEDELDFEVVERETIDHGWDPMFMKNCRQSPTFIDDRD